MKMRISMGLAIVLPSLIWSRPIPIGARDANVEAVLKTNSIQFPYAAPGKVYEVQKVWNPVTKSIEYRSNSSDIPSVESFERLRLEDLRLEKLKYGALSKTLMMKFDSLQDSDEIQAIVYIKYPEVTHPSKLVATQAELVAHSKSLLTLQPVISLDELFRSHGLNPPIHIDSRSGILKMKKSKIKEMMFDDKVYSIEEFEQQKPLTKAFSILPGLFTTGGNFNLVDLAQSAYFHSTSNPPSTAGSGVHAATFESGVDAGFINNPSVNMGTQVQAYDANPAGWSYIDQSSGENDSAHSLQCFWLLHLAAPAASLYHRNTHIPFVPTVYGSWPFGSSDDQTYMVNNGIQTLSISISKTNEATNSEMIAIDEYAYKYPFTVFCNPAGNSGLDQYAGWGSYNSISVGNVRHLNQSLFYIPPPYNCLGACSQTRNPPARGYGGPCITRNDYVGCSSDRELPQIVAPGYTDQTSACTSVPGFESSVAFHDGSLVPLWCGTSWSAPVVNGIAADIIAADSRFYQWPEKVRVAMFVTAENVDGGEWSSGTDGNDGAGVIDGASAVNFAKTHTTTYYGYSGVKKGLAVGSISSSSFSNTLNFNILAPSSIPSGKNLRVVLTWDSNPDHTTPANILSDLDVMAIVNGHTYISESAESNVEIINIPGNDITPNSTITAQLIPYANRIPTGQYIYYAIGWDWTAYNP